MLDEQSVYLPLAEEVLVVSLDLPHHRRNDGADPIPPILAGPLTCQRIVHIPLQHLADLGEAVMLVGDCVAVEGGGVVAASGTMADDADGAADRLAGFPGASPLTLSLESELTASMADSAHQVSTVRIHGWQVLLLK